MASDLEFVEFVVEQIADECETTFRKMFGEYALYSKGKVVALICDNQLFIKPTVAGKEFIGDYVEAPAYPGAKPSLLIEDQIEESEWLTQLIRITERELPTPKPKKKKTAKKSIK
ncbi:TfoX/Sxy family protein [Kangiella koreensis]|uniref:TfoX domain protein n=1 Tax=Kangiella koreensis (strain DSM 16069 / JCM 12317 / KCTC 12182 / SW-125) TaxID=523791 RepID=C7R6U9_KANKD|nr:TfoX/Sxy family protein [Kangiella koreensis]ACV25615.1 TfoX domain protein [Kangiella koreensis DSM 16069]